MGRVLSLDDAVRERAAARKAGRSVVFTNGCFDILHTGHLALLEGAKACGDLLYVGVNRDAIVRGLKGAGRPIVPEDERAELIAALRVVDVALLFAEPTPRETIVALRPDVLVKGGDYTPDTIVGRDEVESWGGRVVVVPLVAGRSSRGIVAEIQARTAAPAKGRGGTR
jgi:D-beta-D-heptose 7-phosphate kinase/D-beta-D-heptose 1-phosphate adenosyltransferase